MTVKEAINELKYSRDMCYFDPSTGETGQPYSEDCKEMAEALDIAIGALESEPVGDCISRQAALDELACMTEKHEGDTFGGDLLHWTGIKTMIENLPAAQPEQKTGQWIYMKDCEDCWLCSNCKDIFILLEGTPKDNNYNYCPNCGAKMESEDQNDT